MKDETELGMIFLCVCIILMSILGIITATVFTYNLIK